MSRLDLEKINISLKDDGDEPKHPSDINKTTWEYILQVIIDMREPEDIFIVDRHYICLVGDMNVESYFDECVANVEPRNLLDILITGHIDKDKLSPPGIYRMVFGGNTGSDQTWTDCGYEYDAWEEYDLISSYKYPKEDEEYIEVMYKDIFSEMIPNFEDPEFEYMVEE